MLLVNEIFASLQGEGPNAGVPTTFLRLQGCNLKCPLCDTKDSWGSSSTYGFLSVEESLRVIGSIHTSNWLCITGGEPLLQKEELKELLKRLYGSYKVEICTNGTLP